MWLKLQLIFKINDDRLIMGLLYYRWWWKKLSHLMNWIRFFSPLTSGCHQSSYHTIADNDIVTVTAVIVATPTTTMPVLYCAELCRAVLWSVLSSACSPQGARHNEWTSCYRNFICQLYEYIEFAFDWPFGACYMPCKSSDINDRDNKKKLN